VSDAPTVAQILEGVRATHLLDENPQCVALVSGGRDSICLLDVLVTLLGCGRVSVLHVNYGLRGAASDGDEEHVRAVCERLGVPLVVERVSSPPAGGNLQGWARQLRYAAARRHAARSGALIATGHTASDQAETILYRLAASPGRRALLGMPARDGNLIRPLLGLDREQTTAYCLARGLAWREDASNSEPRFARARVRHGLLASLRTIHPAAESNVLRTAELLRDEAHVLDRVVDEFLAGRAAVPLAELRNLEPQLARLVLIRLAENAGAGYLPGAGRQLAELEALARAGGSGTLDVGGGVRAVVEYGVLRFELATDDRLPEEVALSVPGQARFGEWTLTAELRSTMADEALAQRRGDGAVAVLDADRLDLDSLRVRGWRAGDSIRPIGLDGRSKSVADLFTDRRFPRAMRALTPIVVCGEEVLWVAPLATADRVRVTPQTRRVALIAAVTAADPG